MNKKANTGLIIGTIFLILSISLIVIIIILINSKTNENNNQTVGEYNLTTVFIKVIDKNTNNPLIANYLIYSGNKFYQKGITDLNYLLLNVPYNETMTVYCYNPLYYTEKEIVNYNQYDISFNQKKIDCKTQRIGKLNIEKVRGDISQTENSIILNISAKDGELRKLGVCLSWTVGIKTIDLDQNSLTCNTNAWKLINNSNYDCDGLVEECKSVQGNQCYTKEINKLDRYKSKYDYCKYLGYTLKDGESQLIRIDVKTLDIKNQLDYLKFTFYDNDLRLIDSELRYVSDENGIDLGLIDQDYIIKYE